MKKEKKSISIKVSILITVLVLAVSLVNSVITFNTSVNTTNEKAITSSISSAKKAVDTYNTNFAYNEYIFTDKLYSATNAVATQLPQLIKSKEQMSTLARNLYFSSIIITDGTGKCVASFPEGKTSTNIKDDTITKKFSKILKGDAFKMQSVDAEDEDGLYSVTTAIGRTDDSGLVITCSTVNNYDELKGKYITTNCNENTAIIKDGKVISSSFNGSNATSLKQLGIEDKKADGNNFNTTINKKDYTCSLQTYGDYTILCGVNQQSTNNYGLILFLSNIIFDVFIIVVLIILLNVLLKKKNS